MRMARVSSTGCYAFRDAIREETLEQHILGIIGCLKSSWEAEGLKQKLSRVHNVCESITNDMLIIAGIMHDVGKARRELQDECNRECTKFRHHYVTSAQLALRLGYEVPELDLNPDNIESRLRRLLSHEEIKRLDFGDVYLLIVLFPVLLHHYSQIVSESSILSGLESPERDNRSLIIHKDCVIELASVINKAVKLLESEVGLRILSILRHVVSEESVELGLISGQTLRDVSSSYEYTPGRLIVEAATGVLNLCDGLVASINR